MVNGSDWDRVERRCLRRGMDLLAIGDGGKVGGFLRKKGGVSMRFGYCVVMVEATMELEWKNN